MTSRAYYSAAFADFLSADKNAIFGALAKHHHHELEDLQKNSWLAQIDILKHQLRLLSAGHIFFEFGIPRMGKRADVVLVVQEIIFVVEFKVGERQFQRHHIEQTVDYGLDLKHFHEGSHDATVVPVLVATKAEERQNLLSISQDGLADCVFATATNIGTTIHSCLDQCSARSAIDAVAWAESRFKPTPTIVQAAQALYAEHHVQEISRSGAGETNLTETAAALSEIIDQAKERKHKAICFVTGVPGAGKTLAGLNIATERMNIAEDEHAVFLSGNGPLVTVLREALARDQASREGVSKKFARQKASAFIQNVHHFRDDNLSRDQAPIEKVVVFDEAQRAWDEESTTRFMRQKRGIENFARSEPQFLLQVMDRHDDWCVIVALIGGGQEINTGEAGLPEWLAALRTQFRQWKVFCPETLEGSEYTQGRALSEQTAGLDVQRILSLHLAVSIRSFRAGMLSAFVHALIGNDPSSAKTLYEEFGDRFPIYMTRDINVAKDWVRKQARGSELYGIVAASGARRLKSHCINVKNKIEPENWFLNGNRDVRSCQYLEDAATEFDIQGLELDWCCVGWDADLRYSGSEWRHYSFKGTKWQQVNKPEAQRYLENAYRVLLTRARQGFVIFLQHGLEEDETRLPTYYEQTYNYLKSCGIPSLEPRHKKFHDEN